MLIYIKEIGRNGKDIAMTMPFDWLSNYFALDDPLREMIRDEINLNFFLSLVRRRVEVRGTFKTILFAQCARCLLNVNYKVNCNVRTNLFPYDEGSKKTVEDFEDIESGIYYNDQVDLLKIVAETFTLSLPITILCRDDCKGLCQFCGINKNNESCNCNQLKKETSFGELANVKIRG